MYVYDEFVLRIRGRSQPVNEVYAIKKKEKQATGGGGRLKVPISEKLLDFDQFCQ